MITWHRIKNEFETTYFKHLLLLFLLLSILILSVMLINLSNTVEHLAISLINRTNDRIKIELDNFFNPVRDNLLISKQLCDQGVMDAYENKKVNDYMLPLFNTIEHISILAIAAPSGYEYSLIREDSTWLNNIVYEEKGTGKMNILRERWKGNISNKEIIKKWEDKDAGYDPRSRPWYKGAMENQNNRPFWTEPYKLAFQDNSAITVSMYSKSNTTESSNVIQLDILLTDITKQTSSLVITENGKAMVLTHDYRALGLPNHPRFTSIDSTKKYMMNYADSLGIKSINEALTAWEKLSNNKEPFKFKVDGEAWWGKITPYELDNGRFFNIFVIVPERDFMNEVNHTRNIIIGGFIIVVVFIFISVRGYLQKRKTNLLLKQKNDEIERQNKEIQQAHEILEEQHGEIQASINYALRIQSALLTELTEFDKISKENFVFFKPRDVVSGDFYWAYYDDENNYAIWAAADCTGHGVPGAFMSMLGIGFLNEIVIEGGERSPSKVLFKLREKIIQALEQKGKDDKQKDGMDITICAWNKKENKIIYAGANNPLWIVRKTTSITDEQKENKKSIHNEETGMSLVEYKADKQPVGWFGEYMTEFTEVVVEVNKGDILYTFSDGFADQFGGPKYKKYMYKPFKNLFLNLYPKSMNDQKEILDKEFNEWKKDVDQIDDVCIIGIKI